MIHVLAPARSWSVEDTWRATGLAGSGSHHYSTQDLFVPKDHVPRACSAPPAAVYASFPLDRMLRDAVTINQHLLFNDGVLEALGAMVLGDDGATRFV